MPTLSPSEVNLAKFERDADTLEATADVLNATFPAMMARVSAWMGGQIECVWYDMEATLSLHDGEWFGSAHKYGAGRSGEILRAATAAELVKMLEAQVYAA